MKNKIIFLMGLGILVVGYMFVVPHPSIAPAKPEVMEQPTKETISVSQKITSPIHKDAEFQLTSIEKGKTALDLLQKTEKITMAGEGKNAFVTEIDGVAANISKKTFWAFILNGKEAPVGAGMYILENGDKIEWSLKNY